MLCTARIKTINRTSLRACCVICETPPIYYTTYKLYIYIYIASIMDPRLEQKPMGTIPGLWLVYAGPKSIIYIYIYDSILYKYVICI